jgi:hypothetical protein
MAVTAVGCLQSERQYRREHESTKFAGTGIGLDDEYVLVDAIIGGPDLNIQPISKQESNCSGSAGSSQAFELTGYGEDALRGMLGRRVVIRGMLKHTKHDTGPVGTSGTFVPNPTNGGLDIGGHDLKLREINVDSFSLVPIAAPVREEPVIHGAPEAPAAAPEPEAIQPTEPAPAPAPAEQALPKTASPLPVIGLLGLISLFGAVGLRLVGRGRARSF